MPKLLLKILNGLHSGSEVTLDDGAYSIGSSTEDDIQFKDASLNSGHAFLKIADGRAEIKASSGNILFANGLTCNAGDEKWTPINPLQVLTIGTTRIAFGPVGANWNTISDDESFRRDVQFGASSQDRWNGNPNGPLLHQHQSLQLAGIVGKGLGALIAASGAKFRFFVIAVVLSSVAYIALNIGIFSARDPGPRDFAKELELVEAAVGSLPFSGKIKVAQEADGQIFVRGIIEDNAERRAVVNALEATHVPVKMRLATSQSIMMDVSNLIQAENVQLKANLQGDGTLVLTGLILNPEKAKRISDLIAEQVNGPTAFNKTGIKDGNDILRDVARAAKLAEVGTSVTFALVDYRLIEATGTLPYARANAWINFLQNYSENFSERVPLRSLVQVIIPEGIVQSPERISSQPIVLGAPAKKNERTLDMDRLASGALTVADVFVANSQADNAAGSNSTAGKSASSGTAATQDDGANAKSANGQGSTSTNALAQQGNPSANKQDAQNSAGTSVVSSQTNQTANAQDRPIGTTNAAAPRRIPADVAVPPTTQDKLISNVELKTLVGPIEGQNDAIPGVARAPSASGGLTSVMSAEGKTDSKLNSIPQDESQNSIAQGKTSASSGSSNTSSVRVATGITDAKLKATTPANGQNNGHAGSCKQSLLARHRVSSDGTGSKDI